MRAVDVLVSVSVSASATLVHRLQEEVNTQYQCGLVCRSRQPPFEPNHTVLRVAHHFERATLLFREFELFLAATRRRSLRVEGLSIIRWDVWSEELTVLALHHQWQLSHSGWARRSIRDSTQRCARLRAAPLNCQVRLFAATLSPDIRDLTSEGRVESKSRSVNSTHSVPCTTWVHDLLRGAQCKPAIIVVMNCC